VVVVEVVVVEVVVVEVAIVEVVVVAGDPEWQPSVVATGVQPSEMVATSMPAASMVAPPLSSAEPVAPAGRPPPVPPNTMVVESVRASEPDADVVVRRSRRVAVAVGLDVDLDAAPPIGAIIRLTPATAAVMAAIVATRRWLWNRSRIVRPS